MKKILSKAAPVLALVAAVGVTTLLVETKPQAEKVVEPERAISLRVKEAQRETLLLSVKTQGEVKAKTLVNLVPEVSGRIIKIAENFVEGGSFKENEMLLKIDDSDYQLAVTRAEARVADAKVKLAQALADARIKEKQWKDWVHDGTPTPLALNKPQVAQAQADMRAAEADLEDAKLDLARTEIRMPYDGRVTERMVGVGQFVNSGSQLGTVFSTDTVEIRLPLTDKQLAELGLPIGYVANGTAPKVELSAQVGGKKRNWLGEVKRVNASVDQSTRLYYAIAEVDDPYGASASDGMPLAVGLFVNAAIEGLQSQNAYVLPRGALRGDDKVFVVREGKLDILQVNVLASDTERLIVNAGINSGDMVVTSAVRSPIRGMAVEPILRPDNTATNSTAKTADDMAQAVSR